MERSNLVKQPFTLIKEFCDILNARIPKEIMRGPWRYPSDAGMFLCELLYPIITPDWHGGNAWRGMESLHAPSVLIRMALRKIPYYRAYTGDQGILIDLSIGKYRGKHKFIGLTAIPAYGNRVRGYAVDLQFVPWGRYMKVSSADLSLTGTGLCVIARNDKGALVPSTKRISTKPGHPLVRIATIVKATKPAIEGSDLVLVEGLSYGSPKRGVNTSFAEQAALFYFFWAMVRRMIHADPIVVAPTRLKKFISGTGTAKKEMILKDVFRIWQYDAKSDDEADAFGLAMLGLAMMKVPIRNLTETRAEVVRDVLAELS
jgi:crossover junction endodeoxyribonuclease RuvC